MRPSSGGIQAAVFAEEVADFTAANAHIAGRNVDVGTNVAIEALHEALAETHDFCVGFACRVEVRTAFCAADREARQGIFEDLFEAQEFNDAGIYVFLEAKTAFVRPDCAVKLEAVACIRMIVAGIVLPYDAEGELSFRYDQAVQQVEFFIFRMFFYNRFQRRQYFFYGLDAYFVRTPSITDSRYLFMKITSSKNLVSHKSSFYGLIIACFLPFENIVI